MRKTMSILIALLCLTSSVALAGEPVRLIAPSERMLLEERNIFSYTAEELYALRSAYGLTDDQEIGSLGYGDDFAGKLLGLHIPFEGMQIMTLTDDPALIAQGSEHWGADDVMLMRVVSVAVTEPGIVGPFGVEVGANPEAFLTAVTEFRNHLTTSSTPGNPAYTLVFVDPEAQPPFQTEDRTLRLHLYMEDGKISRYVVEYSGYITAFF